MEHILTNKGQQIVKYQTRRFRINSISEQKIVNVNNKYEIK